MSGAHGQQAPWSPCPPGDCSPGLGRTAACNAACATPRWRLGIPGASSRSRSHPACSSPRRLPARAALRRVRSRQRLREARRMRARHVVPAGLRVRGALLPPGRGHGRRPWGALCAGSTARHGAACWRAGAPGAWIVAGAAQWRHCCRQPKQRWRKRCGQPWGDASPWGPERPKHLCCRTSQWQR